MADGAASPRLRFRRQNSQVPLDGALTEKPLLQAAKTRINMSRQQYIEEVRAFKWLDWVQYFIPAAGWLRKYSVKEYLLADLLAGIAVAVTVIPQGMSYAKLAGLPNQFGLYGAFVPCLAYALLGSSRQLAVGPVAVTSILLATGLTNMFGDDYDAEDPAQQERYNHAAIQIAFLAGCFYTAIGLLRLGWLTNFLSSSVISGFMTGASIIISLSQVKYILGLYALPRADKIVDQIRNIFECLAGDFFDKKTCVACAFQWREFCMGMAFIFILLAMRFLSNKHRRLTILRALGPLVVTIISIALMNIFEWYHTDKSTIPANADALIAAGKCTGPPGNSYIKAVGKIPKGLPPFTGGWWLPLQNVGKQMTLAILICMIDICESISIAKALATKNKYQLNATQELRGLGLANLFGAMFSAYTTTGSFSRSAINNAVGAKTPLANFVTGIIVMFTLLWITPVFTNMSQNVQGAIIITGVLQLFDYREFLYLWRINKFDWLVWVAAFLFTIFLGVEIGIGVAVGLSLLVVIYKTAFPRIATLGRLPGTDIYRNVKMYADAKAPDGMLLLRIDAPIFFANVEAIKDFVRERVARSKRQSGAYAAHIQFVIFDMSPVTDIDATGIHFLHDFIDQLREQGIRFSMANPSKQVLRALTRAGLVAKIGPSFMHVSMGSAVADAEAALQVANLSSQL